MKRMVEVHQNFHFLTRFTGIFNGLSGWVSMRIFYKTVTVGRRTCHTGDGSVIRLEQIVTFQITRLGPGNRIRGARFFVQQQAGHISCRLGMDGLQPGLHLVIRQGAAVLAVALLPAAGDCVTHRLAGYILDQQPGREQQREIDDREEHHQKRSGPPGQTPPAPCDRPAPVPEQFSIPGKSKLASSHFHSPSAPTGWRYYRRSS